MKLNLNLFSIKHIIVNNFYMSKKHRVTSKVLITLIKTRPLHLESEEVT